MLKTVARILIIEDDSFQAKTLSLILISRGYTAFSAYSGPEGLKMLESEQINALILDIGLKDENGLNLMPIIRKTYPALPIMVLTGELMDVYQQRAEEAGASYFLQKPVRPEQLIEMVELMLENR